MPDRTYLIVERKNGIVKKKVSSNSLQYVEDIAHEYGYDLRMYKIIRQLRTAIVGCKY